MKPVNLKRLLPKSETTVRQKPFRFSERLNYLLDLRSVFGSERRTVNATTFGRVLLVSSDFYILERTIVFAIAVIHAFANRAAYSLIGCAAILSMAGIFSFVHKLKPPFLRFEIIMPQNCFFIRNNKCLTN